MSKNNGQKQWAKTKGKNNGQKQQWEKQWAKTNNGRKLINKKLLKPFCQIYIILST